MFRSLIRIFITGTLLFGGVGLVGGYALDLVVIGALAMGLYMPFTLVSIATWRESNDKDPKEMVFVFGQDAPETISSLYELYRRHKGIVWGTTVLVSFLSGGLLGLWFTLQFPFVWTLTPGLSLTLIAGAALCGAGAGPGLAIVVLSLFKNDALDSNAAGT